MKKILFAGAIALMGLSFTSCHGGHGDGVVENILPPVVAAAPNTLSGSISDITGDAIVGATVSFNGKTATTDAQGIYTFDNVVAGNYKISASADNMVSVSEDIKLATASTTQHYVWNATLAKENTTEVNVTTAEGGSGEVESEALKTNPQGKVEIAVEVPAQTVPEDVKITLTPIYTKESAAVMDRAAVARAEESTLLIGATLDCSDPDLELNQDIDITFNLDESVITNVETKKYVNGQWVDAPHAITDGNVVISDRDFTSYGIFLKVNVNVKTATTTLTMTPDDWNNLNGESSMEVGVSTFKYHMGTAIETTAANKLQGLLIEHLARLYGSRLTELTGEYPINMTIPYGTRVQVSGAQEMNQVTVSSGSTSVKGTTYGTTAVKVVTSSRDHNGGGTNARP